MPAERPVAGFLVACNRTGVVLVHLKTHGPAAPAARRLLRRGQKQRADAAPADMRRDGDRIEPGERGARRIKDEHIAGEPVVRLRYEERRPPRGKEMAKTSPRQNIGR